MSQPIFGQYYQNSSSRGQVTCDPVSCPVRLGSTTDFQWDHLGHLRQDTDTVTYEEKESQRPGQYQLSEYDPSHQNVTDYTNRMKEPTHYQKTYANSFSYVDDESYLWLSELNNLRYRNQLYTRPYAGFYCGPGQPSLDQKDLESTLQQGLLTNLRQKPCEASRGKSMYRFTHLPEFGNPQREEHVVVPPEHLGGWIRGGAPTRDYVRRIDYQRRCANQLNNQGILKQPPQRVVML